MRHNKKAFTLVEMLVALAVSAVIVSATYASFELIQKQYKKNIDVHAASYFRKSYHADS